ncbi:hypothetical protein CG471_11845 [Sphingobium sp. IP1]|uniref:hypothetical protein n=1 Tax=Sphingobium sp. IP1 TaxID=2021637 RepID=UPI000C068E2A|nr:hypothetical protein [Sphingobium sp. IP1]PHP19545.1 hypothetical protein CG471_11845 [Sphingobium sp. IP1]
MADIVHHAAHAAVATNFANDGEGIYFTAQNGTLYISLAPHGGGDGLTVILRGDDIDHVAGLFADTVSEATRQSHPSMGGMQ